MQKFILVHGTSASDESDCGDRWWQRESKFWTFLVDDLRGEVEPHSSTFHWNGRNSETARRKAGLRLLYNELKPLELLGIPYHLVCHSHGGSVTWAAIKEATRIGFELQHLASWVTVGTPFFGYWSSPYLGAHWKALFVLTGLTTVGVALLIGLLFVSDSWWLALAIPIVLLTAITFVGAIVSFIFTLRSLASLARARSERRIECEGYRKYGSRHFAIISPNDEAFTGLRASIGMRGRIAPRYRGHVDPKVSDREFRDFLKGQLGYYRKDHMYVWSATVLIALMAVGLSNSELSVEWHDSVFVPLVANVAAITGSILFWPLLWITCCCAFRSLVYASAMGGRRPLNEVDFDRYPTGKRPNIISYPILVLRQLLYRETWGRSFDWLIAPFLDEFIWIRVSAALQGNDMSGMSLVRVGKSPIASAREECRISNEAWREIQGTADAEAAKTIQRIRSEIESIGAGTGIADRLNEQLSWKELIHNSYFENGLVRQFIVNILQRPQNKALIDTRDHHLRPSGEQASRATKYALRFSAMIGCLPVAVFVGGLLTVILLLLPLILFGI